MCSLAQQLVEFWRSQNLQIATGATIADISHFEEQNGVRLPANIRAYFLATNGMGGRGSQFDEEFFDFWSLRDVIRVTAEFPNSHLKEYYLFADHSIGIIYYAMKLGTSEADDVDVIGIRPPYDGDEELVITFPTFAAFINAYLRGPMRNCM